MIPWFCNTTLHNVKYHILFDCFSSELAFDWSKSNLMWLYHSCCNTESSTVLTLEHCYVFVMLQFREFIEFVKWNTFKAMLYGNVSLWCKCYNFFSENLFSALWQDKGDFELSTLSALVPVFTSASGETLLLLVKHADLIIHKVTKLLL